MKLKVGFIGLGEMGKWMASNILRAGYPLMVYDIRPDPMKDLVARGASAARTPAELARNSNCTLLSLPDGEVVERVIFSEDGLINGLSRGSVVVDLSTTDYLASLRVEERLRKIGVAFIDAPVTGMEARAQDGTLTLMVGGEPEAAKKVRPIFDVLGNNVIYMGKSGNGQLTKLVNQLFFNISAAAMAELLPMAVKLGLDPEAV